MSRQRRIFKRWTGLAIALIWLQALAPLLAAAEASTRSAPADAFGASAIEICSAGGIRLARPDDGTPDPIGHLEFCPDCVICPWAGGLAGAAALPGTSTELTKPALATAASLPVRSTLYRAALGPRASPPRAPPAV